MDREALFLKFRCEIAAAYEMKQKSFRMSCEIISGVRSGWSVVGALEKPGV